MLTMLLRATLCFLCIAVVNCSANTSTASQTSIQYFSENATRAVRADGIANTNIDERPYMVSVRIKPHWWSKSVHCDAVVLADLWALTSARCCVNHAGTQYAPKKVCIRTASATLKPEGVEYKVANVILKDSYTLNSLENNLCLLKVQGSFSFGANLKAIILAESDDYLAGDYARVSGWSNKDGSSNNQLSTVTLPLISNTRCQELYTASGKSASVLSERVICAMSDQAYCHGEGGSPLVVGGKLAGIVTAGSGCGNIPGVYTEISDYRDWITQHVAIDNGQPDIDVRSKFTRR